MDVVNPSPFHAAKGAGESTGPAERRIQDETKTLYSLTTSRIFPNPVIVAPPVDKYCSLETQNAARFIHRRLDLNAPPPTAEQGLTKDVSQAPGTPDTLCQLFKEQRLPYPGAVSPRK